MWIRTKDTKWYIKELCGVNFVSWVNEKDKANAGNFPIRTKADIGRWLEVMERLTGLELESIAPFV